MRKTKGKNKGITLIALVITIIVLLILAGVSIATLMGENGIVTKTQNAKEKNTIVELKEKISLGITQANLKIRTGEESELTEELLTKEIQEQYGTESKVEVVKNEEEQYIIYLENYDKTFQVEGNKIEEIKGITDKKVSLTSSVPITINGGITLEKIKEEVENYKSYEIIGISNEIEGTYSTESADGISGTLTVDGDIKNFNYIYTLKEFMSGDENFYCKILINGETEIAQKITISPAKEMIYEEDLLGFIIPEEYKEYYSIVEDERFSGGKALKIQGKGRSRTTIKFAPEGKKIELLTMIPVVAESENKACSTIWEIFADETMENKIYGLSGANILQEVGKPEWNVKKLIYESEELRKYYISIGVNESYIDEEYPQLNRGNEFYLDAIIVTR